MRTLIAGIALVCATPLLAEIQVDFIEGAPKDRFVVTNTADCGLDAAHITVDLQNSTGGIVFDVTGSGAGVEVFQPMEVVAGRELLGEVPQVTDGDTAVTLSVAPLGAGQSVAFTIDVDDTKAGRQITVSDSEIAGAEVFVQMGEKRHTGVFGARSVAVVPMAGCES